MAARHFHDNTALWTAPPPIYVEIESTLELLRLRYDISRTNIASETTYTEITPSWLCIWFKVKLIIDT